MPYLWPCYLTHYCLQTNDLFYCEIDVTMSSCMRDTLILPLTPQPE